VQIGDTKKIELTTGSDDESQRNENSSNFKMLQSSLKDNGIEFGFSFSDTIHDREIKLSNGWVIKIGRGLDIYQKPDTWFSIGLTDFDLRPCLETKVDIFMV